MVRRLLTLAVETLPTVRSQLMRLQAQVRQILGAIDRVKNLADAGLMASFQCAQANVATEAANVGKALAALSKLLGIIKIFMGLIGNSQVPDLMDLAGRPLDDAIPPFDALIQAVEAARTAVPGAGEMSGARIPFRRDRKRDFASGDGKELLALKVEQVLATEGATAWSSGELPWRGSVARCSYCGPRTTTLSWRSSLLGTCALRKRVPEAQIVDLKVTREREVDASPWVLRATSRAITPSRASRERLVLPHSAGARGAAAAAGAGQ